MINKKACNLAGLHAFSLWFISFYFTSSKTTLANYQKVTNIMVQIW